GFKSRLSSWAYEEARRAVLRFVGAHETTSVALFMRNTTEAINHAARRVALPPGAVVITTAMEHHSNDLPWRAVADVVRIPVDPRGRVDEVALRRALHQYAGRIALLAVSGASNVTGIVNPVHRWAFWAHEAGARILVDGAQLVPHRPVCIGEAGDPEHLDFLAFSGHKMYAPFGVGVLVGPTDLLASGPPRLVGGGTVDVVDDDRVVFTALPDREEAGTPCIIGAVALAAAIREYERIGWPALLEHERELTRELLAGLQRIPSVEVYGDADPDRADERLGVIAFNVAGVPHGLVSAVLAEEWGIGTRNGCFCAHLYAKALLRIGSQEAQLFESRILRGDRGDVPGMVRVSVGIENTPDDVRRLVAAVGAIARGCIRDGYTLDRASGEYTSAEACSDFSAWFQP
ncbi:MAG TPA: aminotransferase class V-fold PLP-dependent enzyme, partial [Dongiaceae bacterium]|nr:aminotransferase class V-fold PLP-dependent enzyme [Dongiaceae bacterium]